MQYKNIFSKFIKIWVILAIILANVAVQAGGATKARDLANFNVYGYCIPAYRSSGEFFKGYVKINNNMGYHVQIQTKLKWYHYAIPLFCACYVFWPFK